MPFYVASLFERVQVRDAPPLADLTVWIDQPSEMPIRLHLWGRRGIWDRRSNFMSGFGRFNLPVRVYRVAHAPFRLRLDGEEVLYFVGVTVPMGVSNEVDGNIFTSAPRTHALQLCVGSLVFRTGEFVLGTLYPGAAEWHTWEDAQMELDRFIERYATAVA